MAVGGDEVLTGLEQCLLCAGEVMLLTLNPSLAGLNDFRSIDIQLENVVVREYHVEILLQIGGTQADRAAHIDVAVRLVPLGVDVAVFLSGADGCLDDGPL